MSSRNTIRHIFRAAVLTILLAAAVRAQSPWGALAQAIAPNKQPAAQQQSRNAQKQQEARPGLPNDATLGVSHGYDGVKPNTELAAAQVRGALSAIADKCPPSAATKNWISAANWRRRPRRSPSTSSRTRKSASCSRQPALRVRPGRQKRPEVVPWVRRAAIIKELLVRADGQLAAGRADQAVAIYKTVLDMRDHVSSASSSRSWPSWPSSSRPMP